MDFRRDVILLIAFLLTGVAFYNKISTYEIAKLSSEELLKSTSYFVGFTLARFLHSPPLDEDLLPETVSKFSGKQVAFLALYDRNGKILLHSDKRRIGSRSDDPAIARAYDRLEPYAAFRTFAGEQTLYVMDMPVDIHDINASPMLLRVALYPYSAQSAVRRAMHHIIVSITIIVFLWILALFFYRFSKKIDTLQQASIKKEQLAMLGEMAAVLAHEIRSPLSAIKGFAQYIAEKNGLLPADEEGLQVIISESNRLEKLTDDLLIYARSDEIRQETFSLIELVDEAWNLVAVENNSISMTKKITIPEGTIHSDREKLRHILINIFLNSVDAMDGQGHIVFKAIRDKRGLTLTIRDSGKGFDDNALKNALTPFFTTKVKGTGLGLSIVDNYVRALSGILTITDRKGLGTDVTITIPWRADGPKKIQDTAG
jgi:two-component system, NtrC family, sensor histidine kinase HydH